MAKKYIDSEKLIHDLEERIFAYSEGYAAGDDCRKDAIETLLKDVKYQLSLQQKQIKIDLEKEIDIFFDGWSIDKDLGLVDDEGWSVTVGDIKNIARHFYELGLKAKKEK